MSDQPVTHRKRLPHLPALDGLRGLAVVAVLLFHADFGFARGGFLGVSVFFTLSGFLITNLLVGEWAEERSISLRRFWSRRFRRLMPAALATLLLVALYGWTVASPEQLLNLRGDLLAALGYVANWRFILAKISYADLFSAPSPVQHFWSLAIEEQFYVVYPLAAFGVLRAGGRRALTVVLGLAAGASLLAGLLQRAHLDRVYYGTDTRMLELLAGGLLAMWWSATPAVREVARTRAREIAVALVGFAGLAGTFVLWTTVGQSSYWVTRGVLPLQAALSVGVIAASARPGVVCRALSWRPLQALGLVSYGLYLYHWPVFLVLDRDRVDWPAVPLFALRIAVTGAMALVSYRYLEQPIRNRRVLVRPRLVRAAMAGGVAAVAASTVLVTWSPPRSQIAHAGVDLADRKVTVQSAAPRSPTATSVPATPGSVAAPDAIMIVGDSGTFDAAPAIGAQFEHLGTRTVVDASFPGFGLTRDPEGWQRDYKAVIDEHRPGLVVVMLGGWDEPYLKEHGRQAYDRVLDRAVSVLTADGAHILWLGMLPGPDTGPDTGRMDPIFRSLAARHPGVVVYGEVGDAVAAPDGTYPRWIAVGGGRRILARKPDGWHVCPDGAARIGRAVALLSARQGWSPPPTTGWEGGPWRQSARYDDPKGGCDATAPSNAPPRRDGAAPSPGPSRQQS